MSRCCCGVRHDHAQRTAGARVDLAAHALPAAQHDIEKGLRPGRRIVADRTVRRSLQTRQLHRRGGGGSGRVRVWGQVMVQLKRYVETGVAAPVFVNS